LMRTEPIQLRLRRQRAIEIAGCRAVDGALAAKAELDRLSAHQALTDEQRQAMNPALQPLRASYDAALKGYHDEAAKQNAALLQKLLADLEALQTRITTTGNLDKALQIKAEKERLAAEAAKGRAALSASAPVAPITPVTPPTPSPGPEPVKPQQVMPPPTAPQPFLKFGNVPIAKATKERPFENSLGMKFVPVPETDVLFCIWETRVKDYAHYARANSSPRGKKVDGMWQKGRDGWPVSHDPDHPVSVVNLDDGNDFCQWLTKKEIGDGKLPKGVVYRLPTDEEWSRAVGLPKEPGNTPDERHRKVRGFPWGDDWPPKDYAGNYADSAFRQKFPQHKGWMEGYTDGFATTAPVGSFPANAYGICDLGGNVSEWTQEIPEPLRKEYHLRGGSWLDAGQMVLASGFRFSPGQGGRFPSEGFRCVIALSAP
ncbi:MAG TPA: SUMF1/EgtB/PvdO family nonheme iron enzyme, partial [Bradyrhizobium sp.]|nr:SUMF1/EgtB/PvdO family nonheme iron enzyme [Bradyrhizobium sp.]